MSIEGCGEKGAKSDEMLGAEGEEWMYSILNLELLECLHPCREFMAGKLQTHGIVVSWKSWPDKW